MLEFFKNSEWRETRVLSWAYIGLIIFISAFVWAPSRDGLEAIYALTFFIPMLLVLFWRKPSFAEYGGWFTAIALLYGGYSVITSLWAPKTSLGFFALQWVILATWLGGVSWVAHKRALDIPKILDILVLVGALGAASHLIVFYSVQPWLVRLEGRSVARNPNVVGEVFGAIALIAYVQWLRATAPFKNFLSFTMLLVLVLTLLASQSRAAYLAFILLAPIACYVIKPSRKKLLLQGGLIALTLVVAGIKFDSISQMFMERGSSLRDIVWTEVFYRSLTEHPFFGIGLEKEGRIIIPDVDVFNHAHNVWLDTLYRTGAIGLLLYLIHFFYLLRFFSIQPELLILYLWLFFGCICCLFDARGFFWQIDAKWFCYWIPAGLIGAVLSTQSPPDERSITINRTGYSS